MESTPAVDALSEASRLSTQARRSGRWYARYLLVYAAVSFALAIGFALVGPRWGAWVLTPLWVVFVIAISVYANHQRTQLRGTTRIHLWMIAAWSVAWAATLFGSFALHQAPWWWVLGGVAMAAPALVARRLVLRRIGGR